jgi:hypothetical protein
MSAFDPKRTSAARDYRATLAEYLRILARASAFQASPQSNTGPEIFATRLLPHIGRDSGLTVVAKYGVSMRNRAISSVFRGNLPGAMLGFGLKSSKP